MLHEIVSHTPVWVWMLLAGLVWLGLQQTSISTPSLQRAMLMPLAMTGLSLYGTVSAFGTQPGAVCGWLVAAALLAGLTLRTRLPAATRYDAVLRRFTVAGSWVPLGLILGIFCVKYTVGVAIAMHPASASEPLFAAVAGTLYGAFSGVFVGRAGRLWKLVQRTERPGSSRLAA